MAFDYSNSNRRWQALRESILRRDGYRCREAARYGKAVEANTVHHIWPADEFPEWAYEPWNLVSLSSAAHGQMHDKVTHRLTALGERWRRNTPPPRQAGF